MTEPHAKLAKVRGLLHTAEHLEAQGNAAAAAETYRNKAIALMAVHGIDEAMVSAAEHRNEAPEQRTYDVANPYRLDKQILLQRVAKGLGCEAIRVSGSETVHVVGFASDLDRVELLWTSLTLQGLSHVAKTPGPEISRLWGWLPASEKRTARVSYTKSFLTGFSVVVGQRLQEATERARADYEASHGASTDLVVADRTTRVGAAYKAAFPNVRNGKRSVRDGAAYARGRAAGERADIGAVRVGENRRRLA